MISQVCGFMGYLYGLIFTSNSNISGILISHIPQKNERMSPDKVTISKRRWIIFQHTWCSENMHKYGSTAIHTDSAGKEWHTAWDLKAFGCGFNMDVKNKKDVQNSITCYSNFNPNSFKPLIQVEKKHLDDPNLQIIPKFPSWLLQGDWLFFTY